MSDAASLDAILAGNRQRRAEQRADAEQAAADAADLADRVDHPGEDDDDRQARRQAEAARQRLKALGVKFGD